MKNFSARACETLLFLAAVCMAWTGPARGDTVTVEFKVEEVRRDNEPEPYHVERRSNGYRVYIGQKNRLLRKGEYTYTLKYATNRQLGFFEEFDELYWNVTGNGWDLPIDEASATVELPPGAHVLRMDAYTGFAGSRGKDYETTEDEKGK